MVSLMNFLHADTDYYSFLQMLKLSGVVEKLFGKHEHTLFVPNNDAFGSIPSKELSSLMDDEDSLREIMLYHILPGKYYSNTLLKKRTLITLAGIEVEIRPHDHFEILVNDAKILKPDIQLDNGVVHIINMVLTPPEILAAIT